MRAITIAGEWLVLLPLWRRITKDPLWHVPAATLTGLVLFIVVLVIIPEAVGFAAGAVAAITVFVLLPIVAVNLITLFFSRLATNLTGARVASLLTPAFAALVVAAAVAADQVVLGAATPSVRGSLTISAFLVASLAVHFFLRGRQGRQIG